jgi:PleD family two-component response regulator
MPDIDGYQVCSTLKADQETSDIPVIFLSAIDEIADKVKAFQVGGVDYITKPFHSEEVIARIQTQLTIQQQKHQLRKEIEQHQQTVEILYQSRATLASLLNSSKDGNCRYAISEGFNHRRN